MRKKILWNLGVLGVALATLPLFAAFEAHVINVTARIENALRVSAQELDFGTVFPQEHLAQRLGVGLSESFLAEDRVDDVEYFIRQKPKCGITSNNGTVLDRANTRTGHVIPDGQGGYRIDCGEPPRNLEEGETWGVLPSLCEYISKEEDLLPDNDGSLASFHHPFTVSTSSVSWLDTPGRLAKSEQDIDDIWTIDLAVPCFGGHCAQDWADFVAHINPTASSTEFIQPLANEHKIFGCDLWVEVSGVSEAGEPIPTPIPSPIT